MSISAAELRKLIKIVRQYEVIYGGGISSSDAAVREECETIIATLESELAGARRSVANSASSLPSLVEAKKGIRDTKANRPKSARLKEIETLGGKREAETVPTQAVAPRETALSKKAAPQAKSAAAGKVAAHSKTGTHAKAAAARTATANSKTAAQATVASSAKVADVDLRSAHKGAAKAAIERADKLASRQSGGAEPEAKRRFAAIHLFDAFAQNRLPKYGGFIVCIRFAEETGYTVIEIIGYENLQDIFPEGDSLVFKSVGCKIYAIVEPANYLLKSVEPVNRPSDQMVPYRFAELLRITTKRFQSILIGRKPVFMPTSFSVYKPSGEDLAVLFYDTAEVFANIQDFTIMILRDRLGVPAPDARKAAESLAKGAREFRLWIDES